MAGCTIGATSAASFSGMSKKTSEIYARALQEGTPIYGLGLTAGVFAEVSTIELDAFDSVVITEADLDADLAGAVDTQSVSEDGEPALVEHPDWTDKLMADVNDYLIVRSEPNRKSNIIGKMLRGDVANVVGYNEDRSWIEITSGNVHGWVKASYCVVGDAAYDLSLEDCLTYATVTNSNVRLRSGPGTDQAIVKGLSKGTRLIVLTDATQHDGWVTVKYGGKPAYVSADYVNVAVEYDVALTVAEEAQALIDARAASGDGIATATRDQRETVIARNDEATILGALVQVESGAESYECKLAVASVVMNRVKSGRYPNTISDVVYQRGQFSTARIAGIISKGVMQSCMDAANEAISGVDNTDGAIGFGYASSGREGVVYGKQVFFK